MENKLEEKVEEALFEATGRMDGAEGKLIQALKLRGVRLVVDEIEDADLDLITEAYHDACDCDGFHVRNFISGLHSSGMNIVSFKTGRDVPEVPLVPEIESTDPFWRLRGALASVLSDYATKVLDADLLRGLVKECGLKLTIAEVDRGDGRKAHYGAGRQPLDDILSMGWAPAFCAGNVLKYLRRAKDMRHSHESARFYWKLLEKLDQDSHDNPIYNGLLPIRIFYDLKKMLTPNELAVVTAVPE